MRYSIKLFLALSMSLFALPNLASAQALPFLNISPDAQSQAMGGAAVASSASPYSIFSNPSAIAFSEQSCGVGASYNAWQVAGVSSNLISAAAYYKLGDKLGVSAAYRSFGQPSYDIYDDNGNHKGEYSPSDSSIDLAVAYSPLDALSVGLTIGFINSHLSTDISGSSVAINLGVSYIASPQLTLAAAYSNMGSITYGDQSYSLPSQLKVGGSYLALESGSHTCRVNLEADMLTSESSFSLGAGGEYSFNRVIFARAGYHLSTNDQIAPSYISLGAGANYANVSLDVAYLIDDVISPLLLSVGYRF